MFPGEGRILTEPPARRVRRAAGGGGAVCTPLRRRNGLEPWRFSRVTFDRAVKRRKRRAPPWWYRQTAPPGEQGPGFFLLIPILIVILIAVLSPEQPCRLRLQLRLRTLNLVPPT